MHRRTLRRVLYVTLALALLLAAPAAADVLEETGTNLAVRTALLDAFGTDALAIGVSVDGRTVTLEGEVAERDVQARAGTVVRRVDGVDQVRNKLVHEVTVETTEVAEEAREAYREADAESREAYREAGQEVERASREAEVEGDDLAARAERWARGTAWHARQEASDALLEIRVKTALLDKIGTTAFDVEVEAQSGVVDLSGVVERQEHARLAVDAAMSVEGVDEIQDHIDVES